MRRFFYLLMSANILGNIEVLQAETVSICINETATFHMHDKAGTEDRPNPGIIIDFLHDLKTKLQLDFKIIRRTKRACYVMLKNNEIDSYGFISYDPVRAESCVYPPMKDGYPDPKYSFNSVGYTLFSNVDSEFSWSGKDISELAKYRVGAIKGESVISELAKHGVTAQTFNSHAILLKRIQQKDIDVIAVHSSTIDNLVSKTGLKKHAIPLFTKAYFLVFSPGFYLSKNDLAKKIWLASNQYLQSVDGQKAMSKYDKMEGFPE